MQPRFTIIQGGLSDNRPRPGTGTALAPGVWRVVLRRPAELREAETEEWRALAARTTGLDPFADPDFQVTAALHAPPGNGGGIAFALAYSGSEGGAERLRGVLPLGLPHPVWGGAAVALWRSPLAPRPVEPVLAEGEAAAVIEAVLAHLTATNPRASLRLTGIAADGALSLALRHDRRFRVSDIESPPSIPEGQFVALGARETVARVERVSAPERIRDAVERFLLIDARRSHRPLLPDPAAASTVRVVCRLFARRGLAEVELGSSWGDTVSGAIRLGREGERVLWRSTALGEAQPAQPRTADVEVALAACEERIRRRAVGLALVTA